MSDPRQILVVYCVAHEGISTGAVVGMGRVHKTWCAERIEELNMRIAEEQILVYIGHPNGRRHRRIPVGYIIDSYTAGIEGCVSAMAIVQFTDPLAAKHAQRRQLDLASLEANLSLDPTPEGWDVGEVECVTGLAIADARYDTPGFERAGLIRFIGE